MCMFCKGDTVKESVTTHVVNYKNCIIVIKMSLARNASSAGRSSIPMKLPSVWKSWYLRPNSLCRKSQSLTIKRRREVHQVLPIPG